MRKFLLLNLNALADDVPWLFGARQVAGTVPSKLVQNLKETMAKVASAQTGWASKRVSLLNRKSNAVTDGLGAGSAGRLRLPRGGPDQSKAHCPQDPGVGLFGRPDLWRHRDTQTLVNVA